MAQTVPAGRRTPTWATALALAATVVAGCSTGGHTSPPTTPAPPSAPTTAPESAATPGPQTSGARTVLSPTGLNVRGAPSPSAPVLGSAAQGAVLTVLGYTSTGGGWFKVKGATVTGWITAEPGLSGPGEFHTHTSSQVDFLYPADWTESTLPGPAPAPTTSTAAQATPTSEAPPAPSRVSLRPGLGAGDIVIISAGGVSELPQGRPGYGRISVTQVVVCGVTAGLVVFQRTAATSTGAPATSVPESLAYLAEVRFAVGNQQALGFYADMPDLGPTFDIFKEVLASVTFSSPQCSG